MKEKIRIRDRVFEVSDLVVTTTNGKVVLPLYAETAILLRDHLEDLLSSWARDCRKPDALSVTIHERDFTLALSRAKAKNKRTPEPEFILSTPTGRVSLNVWGARRLFQKIGSC